MPVLRSQRLPSVKEGETYFCVAGYLPDGPLRTRPHSRAVGLTVA